MTPVLMMITNFKPQTEELFETPSTNLAEGNVLSELKGSLCHATF